MPIPIKQKKIPFVKSNSEKLKYKKKITIYLDLNLRVKIHKGVKYPIYWPIADIPADTNTEIHIGINICPYQFEVWCR